MKTCNKCDKALPLEEFYLNGSGTRRPECRACLLETRRAHYRENSERIKHRVETYRKRNPEAVKASHRKYHQANRERRNAAHSEYFANKYYPANKDQLREKRHAWEERNPDMLLLKRMRRLSRRLSRPISFDPQDCRKCFGAFGGRCVYCGAKATTLDHFIPLAAPDCPGTVPANMLPACSPCNFSKASRQAEIWLTKRFGAEHAVECLAAIRSYFQSLA